MPRHRNKMARTMKCTAIHNIIRASKKRKGRAAALLNIFYFSLYDIGMARKSAHRFGIHDFLQFQSFKCLRSSIFLP